ncbi:MAG TPA: GNAT family N-acetyltransferase, partial [Pyrinomonadaceae bacterium]
MEIRQVTSIEEYDACVRLQREVFGLPDLEISPRRHLIVTTQAGGWALGAFVEDRLVGFVLHLPAVRENDIFGYSHMMAVAAEYQNQGVGARLKWAQRARALSEGRSFIKWTFEPIRARNAHFNLNRLGVVVRAYAVNFYGTDYATVPADGASGALGMDSDRLFASWELRSPRVEALADRREVDAGPPDASIEIPNDFSALLKSDPAAAKQEARRIREEFLRAFGAGLVCRAFA